MIGSELPGTPDIKQCCALLYGSEAARFLLGDSFHPGGIDLTLDLAGRLCLSIDSHVLDVASGRGTSAMAVAERFGCRVTGIDLSAANVADAGAAALERGLADRVTFVPRSCHSMPPRSTRFSVNVRFARFPIRPKPRPSSRAFCDRRDGSA